MSSSISNNVGAVRSFLSKLVGSQKDASNTQEGGEAVSAAQKIAYERKMDSLDKRVDEFTPANRDETAKHWNQTKKRMVNLEKNISHPATNKSKGYWTKQVSKQTKSRAR